MIPFVQRLTVAMADTDAAGIVHFSRIFLWVEAAEAEWLESLGLYQFRETADGARSGFPKVSVQCNYRRPMRYRDAVEIRLAPLGCGATSLTYNFQARVGDAVTAEGQFTVLFAEMPAGGLPRKLPLPEALRQAVGVGQVAQQ